MHDKLFDKRTLSPFRKKITDKSEDDLEIIETNKPDISFLDVIREERLAEEIKAKQLDDEISLLEL